MKREEWVDSKSPKWGIIIPRAKKPGWELVQDEFFESRKASMGSVKDWRGIVGEASPVRVRVQWLKGGE